MHTTYSATYNPGKVQSEKENRGKKKKGPFLATPLLCNTLVHHQIQPVQMLSYAVPKNTQKQEEKNPKLTIEQTPFTGCRPAWLGRCLS